MQTVARERPERARKPTRLNAVERAEAYARAHLGASVSISALCQVVGLSERGLRNAFYDVRGASPKRALTTDRLRSVRRALRERVRQDATVTGVATHYGFYELGRFAAIYRRAFGEVPSATLRARGSKSPDELSKMKGDPDASPR